jgi:hypothetical protein
MVRLLPTGFISNSISEASRCPVGRGQGAHTGLADKLVQRHCSERVDAVFGRRPIPGMSPRSRAEHHVVIAKAEISGMSSDVSILAKVQRFSDVLLYGESIRDGPAARTVVAHISPTLTELAE